MYDKRYTAKIMLNNSDLPASNNTERMSISGIPDFGPDTPHFAVIHISALVALGMSITASTYTLVYLRRNETGSFYKWKLGQRMVLYLAVADLLFSVPHPLDHVYSLFQIETAFEVFCTISAFILQTFGIAQGVLISIISVSAFVTVSFNKRITFGKYDWKLLVTIIGFPVSVGIVMASLDWFGPSGYWCHADMRKQTGLTVHTICTAVAVGTFMANLAGYVGVWATVVASSKRISQFQNKREHREAQHHHRTAKILILFVLAYLSQWLSYITYTIWSYFDRPHWIMTEIVVLTVNSGGVFNFVAYTFVRRKTNDDKKPTEQTISNYVLRTVAQDM